MFTKSILFPTAFLVLTFAAVASATETPEWIANYLSAEWEKITLQKDRDDILEVLAPISEAADKKDEDASRDAALKILEKTGQHDFVQGAAHFVLAIIDGEREKLDDALEHANKGLNFFPDNETMLHMRVFIHAKQENNKKALDDLETLIRLHPDKAEYFVARISLSDQDKDADQIIADLEKVTDLAKENWEYPLALGQYRFSQEKYDAAVAAFDKAIERGAKSEDAYALRGMCHAQLGNKDKAIADFTEAEKIDKEFGLLLVKYYPMDHLEKGINLFTEAIAKEPTAEAYAQRADFYAALKKYDEALDDLERVLELSTEKLQVLASRILFLHKIRERENAMFIEKKYFEWGLADCNTVLEKYVDELKTDNHRWDMRLWRLNFMRDKKDWDEIIKGTTAYLEIAGESKTLQGNLYFERGFAYTWKAHDEKDADVQRELREKALADLDKTIELIPDHVSAYKYKSSVLKKLGRDDEADAAAAKAKELENR